MGGGHDFGDDGQAGFPAGMAQQLKALGPQALEGVGGSARLERAAPQEGRTRRLDAGGHLAYLLLAFHGAGAGNELAAADNRSASEIDDGVVRVELAVGFFIGLLDAADALNNILGGDGVHIHRGGVAQQAQDGGMLAVPGVDSDAVGFGQVVGEILHLVAGDAGF